MNAPILARAISATKREEKRRVWKHVISEFVDFWVSMFTLPFRSPFVRTVLIAGVGGFVLGQMLVIVPETGSLAVAGTRVSLQVVVQSVLTICAHALVVWTVLASVVSLVASIVIDGVLGGWRGAL
jgi:hypothetical protein